MNFQRAGLTVGGRHPDMVILAILSSGKAQCVLAANLSGDSYTDVRNLADLRGKKRVAAGFLGNPRKHLRITVAVILVEESNRIHDGPRLDRGAQRIVKR